jgi:hypothetical protein
MEMAKVLVVAVVAKVLVVTVVAKVLVVARVVVAGCHRFADLETADTAAAVCLVTV